MTQKFRLLYFFFGSNHEGHKSTFLVKIVICLFYLNFQKGVITKVYDGDTLTFVPDNKKHDEWKIRLAEIDCPESDQPCGKEATDYLKVFFGAQSFTSLKGELYQDINGYFLYIRCLNGTFP